MTRRVDDARAAAIRDSAAAYAGARRTDVIDLLADREDDARAHAEAEAALHASRVERDEWTGRASWYEQNLTEARSEAARMTEERDEAREFIAREGYQRCDVPACNCGLWHGGHWRARLQEIRDMAEREGVRLNGRVLCDALYGAITEARAALDAERALTATLRARGEALARALDALVDDYRDELGGNDTKRGLFIVPADAALAEWRKP